jgi:tetratricopeptide (TPR) repeat protein/predicted Ser/Thr protein kinase
MTEVGSHIGSIRLTSDLGHGGMGQVYEGFDETLNRRVAVKAIRGAQALSREGRARFLLEARTLSSLRHPNICLVHDYLEFEGEAYLVMELIEGPTLSHALKEGLSWSRKLDIAIQVAEVLMIAHARGIVHRDIKPDNLMLTREGELKVLDFGIARVEAAPGTALQPTGEAAKDGDPARALTRPAAEHEDPETLPPTRMVSTALTVTGGLVGTPNYMSPEQARGEEVSPASDMFSFGLVLQRLFTEESPYEAGLSLTDLVKRASRGKTLPVEGVTAELTSLIERLKALKPEDRPNASQASARLQRLRDRPRRRRRMATIAIVVLIVALVGIKYTVDLRGEREQAVIARNEAEMSRDQAQAVNDFLVELLASARPGETMGKDVTVREVLDQAAAELPDREDIEVSSKVRFLVVTGSVYEELGLLEEARSVLTMAAALAIENPDITGREHAQTLLSLGWVEESLGEFASARERYEQAAEVAARKIPDNLQARAAVLVALGNIQSADGDLEGSVATYEQALAMIREVKGPDHPQAGMILGNLANMAQDMGDCERSITLNEEALQIFEGALEPGHPLVTTVLNNVANCYEHLDRLADAADAYLRALAGREEVLGAEHSDTGQTLLNLAAIRTKQGQLDEAQQLLDRGAAITLEAFGTLHPQSLTAELIAIEILEAREDLETAEQMARSAVATASMLEGHLKEADSAPEYLFRILLKRDKPHEALELAEATLRRRRSALGEEHVWVASGWVDVAEVHLALGDKNEARAALETAQAIGYILQEIDDPPGLAALAREVGEDSVLTK